MNRFFTLVVTLLALASCGSRDIIDLPRRKASAKLDKAFSEYLRAVETDSVNMHSVMIVQHGKVLEEKWFGDETPGKPHILHSVSKTFTATAVGLAANEGLLKLSDRLVDFFPGAAEKWKTGRLLLYAADSYGNFIRPHGMTEFIGHFAIKLNTVPRGVRDD